MKPKPSGKGGDGLRHGKRLRFVLRQMLRRYFADGVPQLSAELAYFLLFAFFPLLMFVNSVLASLRLSEQSLNALTQFLPQSLQDLFAGYFAHLGQSSAVRPMVIGIVLTLFFASRAMRSLMRTANHLYRVERRAGGVLQTALSVLFTAGFLLLIVLSLIVVIVGKTVLRFLARWILVPHAVAQLAGTGSRWLVMLFLFLYLMLFNRVVPNLRLGWRDALPGAVFSVLLWAALSLGFSYYVDNMGRYSLLYGSLGAMIVLMLWLYLLSNVLIMGTQLNHVLFCLRQERQPPGGAPPGDDIEREDF